MKLLETLQTAAAKAEEEFEKAKSAYQYALVDDWRLSCEEDRQESLIERSLRALGNEEVEALIRETHRVWSLAVAQLRYDRKGRVVNEEMGKRRNRLASIIDEAKSLLSDGRSPAEIRDSVNVLGHEVRALTPLFSSDVAPMKATSLV
ncbi:MAG: hypothetical protein GC151_13270 [Betaproteobacteria bacterium]|nr:hypothetical protein [Betaproteobacteria bacterium]